MGVKLLKFLHEQLECGLITAEVAELDRIKSVRAELSRKSPVLPPLCSGRAEGGTADTLTGIRVLTL